jgi:chromosome segregation ATPase
MARSGILYSDVIKAASQLINEGKSPTVDNVREAMGGTGSKSTIAPLLKRWKIEHQDSIENSSAGIPASLLQSVKNLHQHMQEESLKKLEVAQQEHQAQLLLLSEQSQALNLENADLYKKNSALENELQAVRQAAAGVQEILRETSAALNSAESERTNLQLRLTDRNDEVKGLTQQLNLTRTQFDHYQEAIATQRAQEKQDYEQRISRLEQECRGTQQRLLAQQSVIAQQETRIAQLSTDNARLESSNDSALEELSRLHASHEQLNYQHSLTNASNASLTIKLDEAQLALMKSEMGLSAQQAKNTHLTEQLGQAELKLQALDNERRALIHETATLQAQAKFRDQAHKDEGVRVAT